MAAYLKLLFHKVYDWLVQVRRRGHDDPPHRGGYASIVDGGYVVVPNAGLPRLRHGLSLLSDAATLIYTSPHTQGSLYLGNASNSADLYWLKSRRINAIINCTEELPNLFAFNNIQYYRLQVRDLRGARLFRKPRSARHLLSYIHRNMSLGKNILVHCFAGSSRSAAVCVFYLLYLRVYPHLQSTYDNVCAQRPVVHINSDFLREVALAYQQLERDGAYAITTLYHPPHHGQFPRTKEAKKDQARQVFLDDLVPRHPERGV